MGRVGCLGLGRVLGLLGSLLFALVVRIQVAGYHSRPLGGGISRAFSSAAMSAHDNGLGEAAR